MTEKEKEKKEPFFVIPESVFNNPYLTPEAFKLYILINSLSRTAPCFAKNEYFAEKTNISLTSIKKAIRLLKDLNLIKISNKSSRYRKISTGSNPDQLLGRIPTSRSQCSTIYEQHKSNNPPKPPKGSIFSTTEIQDLNLQFKAIAVEDSIEKFFAGKVFTNKRDLKKSKKLFIDLITKQNLTDYQGLRTCLRL